MRNNTKGSLALTGFDDIFGGGLTDTTGKTITEIPITELYPPDFHPFQVNDDQRMASLVKSISQYGVREPGLVRPRSQGGYELLAGNRRKRACELAGIGTMPVIIRDFSDDNAAIAMVDSNLEHREKLLPSEKAWAYRVKLEALNHNGIKGDMLSVDVLAEQTGESKNQIFRLVRLTELVVGLLDMVDARKLAFNPAVELSYLSQKEQTAVVSAIEKHDIKPSLSQAVQLKKMKQDGTLTVEQIDEILSANKKAVAADKEITRFSRFFPKSYTTEQIDKVIMDLLSAWQAEQKLENVL